MFISTALPEKWLTGNLRTDTRLFMQMTAQPILPRREQKKLLRFFWLTLGILITH